jgi:hypothetical protein
MGIDITPVHDPGIGQPGHLACERNRATELHESDRCPWAYAPVLAARGRAVPIWRDRLE